MYLYLTWKFIYSHPTLIIFKARPTLSIPAERLWWEVSSSLKCSFIEQETPISDSLWGLLKNEQLAKKPWTLPILMTVKRFMRMKVAVFVGNGKIFFSFCRTQNISYVFPEFVFPKVCYSSSYRTYKKIEARRFVRFREKYYLFNTVFMTIKLNHTELRLFYLVRLFASFS